MGPSGDRPAVWSLRHLGSALGSPFGLEDAGGATTPLLVLRLDGADVDDHLIHALDSVSAVTVAVLDDAPVAGVASLAAHVDIVLAPPEVAGDTMVPCADPDAALDALADAVTANPQASVAVAQLLRLRCYASVPHGLVAESLTYSMLQAGAEFAAWLTRRGRAELPPDTEPPVLVRRAGTSMEVVLNRPARANAFTASMRDHLVEALRVAAADPAIEGVILSGAGRSFSSGGDLAEFGSAPDPATAHRTRLLRSPAWWVDHLSRDVRAHLHGACIGAGIEVPAFAGTVVAAADTRIRLPEVAMGLVPGAGGTVSLPRRIGPQRTAYLAITGAELSATEALRWGLVDRVEPPSEE